MSVSLGGHGHVIYGGGKKEFWSDVVVISYRCSTAHSTNILCSCIILYMLIRLPTWWVKWWFCSPENDLAAVTFHGGQSNVYMEKTCEFQVDMEVRTNLIRIVWEHPSSFVSML